jgi:hypothetical protein
MSQGASVKRLRVEVIACRPDKDANAKIEASEIPHRAVGLSQQGSDAGQSDLGVSILAGALSILTLVM